MSGTLYLVRPGRSQPPLAPGDRVVYIQTDPEQPSYRDSDADSPIDPAELTELFFQHRLVVVW